MLDQFRAFFESFNREETVLVNTYGYYSSANSIKHTLLLNSHAALDIVLARSANETAMFAAMDDLRNLPTSDFYESGDIFNFAGQAGDVEAFWPWAKIRTRELNVNQFGAHVSGWLNRFEPNTDAMAPVVLNRVYESALSNDEKKTLLTEFMDHLNKTDKVQGELTNLIIWVHDDGFTISHGFLSAFGYDLFMAEVDNFKDAKIIKEQVSVFTQWIGTKADIDGLAFDGEEKYYGRPDFTPYGGDGQWLLIDMTPGPFNIKAIWALVPILDIVGAIVNVVYWPEFTSGWWLIVELIQAGMGVLGLLFWAAAMGTTEYGDVGDAILAIYSLFHTIGEGAIVGFTAFADYLAPAPNGDNSNAIVTYVFAGINIFMNLVVNITFLIGMDLDDLNSGIQTKRVAFVRRFRAKKFREALL